MIIDLNSLIYDLVANSAIESHLENKIKFQVVDTENVGKKFAEAVKKEYTADHLKDAQKIIRFAEKIEEVAAGADDTSDQSSEEGAEEQTADQGSEDKEEIAVDQSEDTGDQEEKKDDEEEKDQLDENIKVQDLTKSMVQNIKTSSTKKSCVKEEEKEKEEKQEPKKEKTEEKSGDKEEEKSEGKEEKKEESAEEKTEEKVEEAETTASGAELKSKIVNMLSRSLAISKEKVELFDLPEFLPGYNVYFTKISFKVEKETEVK